MLSPNMVFKVYFGDEVFSAGIDSRPEGEFGTFEAAGSGGGGTGEALAVVSRADMDIEIVFLSESFIAT
jgi:hypothetical protein